MKEERKNELIGELLLSCLELTDENFTAFFEYSAHCDSVCIRVFKFGWVGGAEPSMDEDLRIRGEWFNPDSFEGDCMSIISDLKELKADGARIKKEMEQNADLAKQIKRERLLKELECLDN